MPKSKLDKKIGTAYIRGKKVTVRRSPKGGRYYLKRGKKVWIAG